MGPSDLDRVIQIDAPVIDGEEKAIGVVCLHDKKIDRITEFA